jgi:hypothetical protein
MDTNKTIKILEALASGCSPTTGEMINNESILNERDVIRALQIAIDKLKNVDDETQTEIEISDDDIKFVLQLFKEQDKNPSPDNLTGFFLGTRKFKNSSILSSKIYGKFKNIYREGQLLDFFANYILENKIKTRNILDSKPYIKIDYFQKVKFNNLTENAINQLKEKINELGILKTENLSVQILEARKSYPRAYEHWSDEEAVLLSKAIKYTNDLELLSACFQRAPGSIESFGQKIIYNLQSIPKRAD